MTVNPYETNGAEMRRLLEDPAINSAEHEVYAPRFLSILPAGGLLDGGIKRVLDFGCGAGNFTAQVYDRFPKANIVGTDASATIFDHDKYDSDITFVQWDGQAPLEIGEFDLIVSKMAVHYLSLHQLATAAQNLMNILANGGELAVAAPFKGYEDVSTSPLAIQVTNEVGKTGIAADMWQYSMIPAVLAAYTPPGYGYAIDTVMNSENEYKRVNMLFYPKHKFRTVRRRLVKAGISNGESDWETTRDLTDILRDVGRYIVNRALKGDS